MRELITPSQIKRQLLAKWEKGYYLKHLSDGFPLTVSLGTLSSRQMSDDFSSVQSWIDQYRRDQRLSEFLQWNELNHRLFGRQLVPRSLLFATPEDLARYLTKSRELESFSHLLLRLQAVDTRLESWGRKYPLELLKIAEDLERLSTLYRWMIEHPRPRVYLRQIDLPGIDTKFTETYKGILSAWLDLTLESEYIDETTSRFEDRYGYCRKPELVRFRYLDPALSWRGCSDISIPSDQFAGLYRKDEELPITHVFVLENDISALSFPKVANAIALFGRGYTFDALKECAWLHRVELHYWGDIDTHGFRILDQFRSIFPHTRSFLMDWQTLRDHEISWGEETKPTRVELKHLTQREQDLYDELRFDRIRKNLRLEQEFIRYSAVEKSVGQIAFCL